jgi:hypothetical protein
MDSQSTLLHTPLFHAIPVLEFPRAELLHRMRATSSVSRPFLRWYPRVFEKLDCQFFDR